MSSFSSNEPQVTSQPDPDMNQVNLDHGVESALPQAAQVVAQRNAATPPPTQKLQQRSHCVQPRSSQSKSRSSKAQVGEQVQKSQQEDVAEQDDDNTGDDDQLARLDWVQLERRYREVLIEADNTENELNTKFDAIADSFQIWSQTAAHQVNERAQKRLRTRITHVQLAEKDLDAKIQKYNDVVHAFKTALEILRRPMTLR